MIYRKPYVLDDFAPIVTHLQEHEKSTPAVPRVLFPEWSDILAVPMMMMERVAAVASAIAAETVPRISPVAAVTAVAAKTAVTAKTVSRVAVASAETVSRVAVASAETVSRISSEASVAAKTVPRVASEASIAAAKAAAVNRSSFIHDLSLLHIGYSPVYDIRKETYGHPPSFGEIINNCLRRHTIQADRVSKIKRPELMPPRPVCLYSPKSTL